MKQIVPKQRNLHDFFTYFALFRIHTFSACTLFFCKERRYWIVASVYQNEIFDIIAADDDVIVNIEDFYFKCKYMHVVVQILNMNSNVTFFLPKGC